MNEDTKQRFEILKMAREMLNQEYTFKRATDHNKWLVDSHEAWTKHQKALPHPPFEPYPTEAKVLDAAETLYNFVYNTKKEVKDTTIPTVVTAPVITPTVDTATVIAPVTGKPIEEGDFVFPRETKDISIVETIVKEPEEQEQVSKGFLPGWVRRSK